MACVSCWHNNWISDLWSSTSKWSHEPDFESMERKSVADGTLYKFGEIRPYSFSRYLDDFNDNFNNNFRHERHVIRFEIIFLVIIYL